IMLATGLIVAYGYMMEAFISWYSGNPYEMFMILNRMRGPYAPFYWLLITCNVVLPQLLWIRGVRNSPVGLWCVSIIVNIGMWLERFVIIAISLHRDFLPSSWGMFHPSRWDVMTFIGTRGLFLALLFLFVRFLPV